MGLETVRMAMQKAEGEAVMDPKVKAYWMVGFISGCFVMALGMGLLLLLGVI